MIEKYNTSVKNTGDLSPILNRITSGENNGLLFHISSIVRGIFSFDFPIIFNLESQFIETAKIFDNKKARNDSILKTNFQEEVIFRTVGMESISSLSELYEEKKVQAVFQYALKTQEPGIEFDPREISRSKITNGLCSAIALTTLRYMFEKKSTQPLSEKLIEAARNFTEGAPKDVAIIQAIFNSITVKENAMGDIKHAKMQSLANLFELKLTPYPSIEHTKGKSIFGKLDAQINSMPDGPYLIRMLWKKCGHSMVFLKEKGKAFLFDTGIGLLSIDPHKKAETLQRDFDCWDNSYHEVRFYRVKSF